ncbi:MAG: S-adenosylmethionine:tRNA ribosyltransferase-isomerase [Chitinophagales bacterium]|nr:S-adenosylmethionine:tRNA ribosyltransferase-isomerase [Chitinophagales bacterium]
MTDPRNISIEEYAYELPDDRIALHPLAERDASKLLIYQDGVIREDIYRNIDQYVPANSLLIFNNTRVIRARIRFQKESGGLIEIFCLEPYEPISDFSTVMNRRSSVRWKCMIGGASKWKTGSLKKELNSKHATLEARLVEKLTDAYVVEFSWTPPTLSFAEILDASGDIPLPPYIKRKNDESDATRYQTIYARDEGSVAAPTAGLHFTQEIFDKLNEKGIRQAFLTLHVGAGTFKPVKATTMADHDMHAEWIDVTNTFIQQLVDQYPKPVVAVGTTSLRTLESLYWMGVKTALDPSLQQLALAQWEVYDPLLADSNISLEEALRALLNWLDRNKRNRLFTQSQILIAPGYRFRVADALVTNFHQPRSTLLLLVAAAVGYKNSEWKKIYEYALSHHFRFLSYGDGSLLFIQKSPGI